jgi:hypothetical protein
MKKTEVTGFDAAKLERDLTNYWVGQQNAAFIAYAEEKVKEIGDRIQSFQSRNHMDDKGNLLDSLYWGVSYRGKAVKTGFYRRKKAKEDSYLHDWFKGDYDSLFPVNGRLFAKQHIERFADGNESQGWRVWFAILAPYWGYWENGFRMKIKPTDYDEEDVAETRFMRFAVMTEFYDIIKGELKQTRVRFRHPVSQYTATGLKRYRDRDFEGKIKDKYSYRSSNLNAKK